MQQTGTKLKKKQLEEALQQMNMILGESLDTSSQNSFQSRVDKLSITSSPPQENSLGANNAVQSQQFGEGLDHFVRILDKKYAKVSKILENEEQQVKTLHNENVQLKGALAHKLSQNIQNGGQNILLHNLFSNQEHQILTNHQNQPRLLERNLLSETVSELELQVQQTQDDIQQGQAISLLVNDDATRLRQEILALQQEVEEEEKKFSDSEQFLQLLNQQQNEKAQQLFLHNAQLKLSIEKLQKQKATADELQYKEQELNSEQDKIRRDVVAAIKRRDILQASYLELEDLHAKLEEELNNKASEMSELRIYNQHLEEQEKEVQHFETQLQYEKSINTRSLHTKMLLQKEAEQISEFEKLCEQLTNALKISDPNFQPKNASEIVNRAQQKIKEKQQIIEIQQAALDSITALFEATVQDLTAETVKRETVINQNQWLEQEMDDLRIKYEQLDQNSVQEQAEAQVEDADVQEEL